MLILMKRYKSGRMEKLFLSFFSRIAKEDNIRYLMKSGDVIDPTYIFTYEEWQKIINTVGGKLDRLSIICQWYPFGSEYKTNSKN